MRDFSFFKYRQLIEAIAASDYQAITFEEFFDYSDPPERFIIMRHDVDKWPGNALQLAHIEHDYEIRTTYYFRNVRWVFKPKIIRAVRDLGHEIGYHYETMAQARGQKDKAFSLFQKSLSDLRQLAEVKTICMHGSSFSKYDNRWLWDDYDYRTLGIIGEPYLDIDYSDIRYFSDSGGSWQNSGQRTRDKITEAEKISIEQTDDLIALIKQRAFDQAIILSHPDRWNDDPLAWYYENTTKKIRNSIKRMYNSVSK